MTFEGLPGVLWTAGTLAAFFIAREYFKSWAKEQGAVGAKQTLAQHQANLDVELERQKAHLAQEAEQLRSALLRDAADDAIYVAKRHDAIATLYAAFLNAVRIPIVMPPEGALVDDEWEAAAEQARKASKAATEAYNYGVLYLPPAVDAAALEAVHAFWYWSDAMAAHKHAPEFARRNERLRDLREHLNRLRDVSRDELRRARPSPSFLERSGGQLLKWSDQEHDSDASNS